VRWDHGRPYLIRHDADGACTHLDRALGTGCTVYAQRPATCRTYDCRTDPRIWRDFARRELAPIEWEPADRAFTGRPALERERAAGPAVMLAGIMLGGRGVMRRGQRVITASGEGLVTSGGFSPTMNCSIGLARVPVGAAGACEVEIRGVRHPARLLRPPFVRRGRVLVT